MKVRPGWVLLRLALLRSVQLGLLLVGLVWLGSAVESGQEGLSLLALLGLLAPVSAAAGTAMALAELRRKGEWSAWQALGYAPRRQVLPLLLLVVLGVLGQLGLSSLSSLGGGQALQLPAPVAESARSWPGVEAAQIGQLELWQRRPAELTWRELQARHRSTSPSGARPGVDLAELLRRTGWALAWPFGILAGLGVGLRTSLSARDRRGPGPLLAAVLAGLVTVGWCLAVLVLSAAQSAT